MKYILVALLNVIYGVLILSVLSQNTAGYFLILSIAVLVSALGIIGLVLYLINVFSSLKESDRPELLIKSWYQITKNVDIVLILGLLFRAFILQPFIVDGSSMETNFHNNEYLLVDQVNYRFREPRHGEVIVFRPPLDTSMDYIKRIIALPGETVVIENGKVSVNGHLLSESYLISPDITKTKDNIYRMTMKPGEYFVMGDNRDHSSDSREWGAVPKSNIVGRAWFVVYPTSYFGLTHNPSFNIYQSATSQPGI